MLGKHLQMLRVILIPTLPYSSEP